MTTIGYALVDLYHERAETPSDIVEHLAYMHDAVIEADAKTVVELGVRSGNSTAALLAAVDRTGGHVWSVDIEAPVAPAEFYRSGRWILIVGDDLTVADAVPEQIDILFIDSSHHYEHTLAELRLYGSRSKVILLHDTELERPHMAPPTDPPFPVKAAIEAWSAETGRSWTNRPNCWGLGIIHPEGA